MKSKQNQLAHLGHVLQELESGLYLIDTELDENDIENYIYHLGVYSFNKEELIPAVGGSPFELFVIAMCRQFECEELNRRRCLRLNSKGCQKENLIYDTLISIIKILNKGRTAILLLYGELDISSFKHEELAKLKYSVCHHGVRTIILSKHINESDGISDKLVKRIILNSTKDMEDRKFKVHITYKHNDAHKLGIDAIIAGFDAHKIPYSIDEYDIKYRDNIQEYEDEIGASDMVVMFVISEYLESLDCMYEMTQLFKKGNVSQRVFPIVDLGKLPRNGDGLAEIQKYWQAEIDRKKSTLNGSATSNFILDEIKKINNILKTLDDFWEYIVHINTCKYEDMIANNAERLMVEIERCLDTSSFVNTDRFTPSYAAEPEKVNRVVNQGGKSVYIEKNEGIISIS